MCTVDELTNLTIVQLLTTSTSTLLLRCKNINKDEESDAFLFLVHMNVEFRPQRKKNPRLPLSADLGLPQLYIFLFKGMLEPRVCVEICHSGQDQFWKLEVRRLLQWASNGRIMQWQSSGCPHYLAAVVMNGLKCTLSKSEEKCDPSAKIQMVPLQGRCGTSLCTLFVTQLMLRCNFDSKQWNRADAPFLLICQI